MNFGIIGTGGRSLAYLSIIKRLDKHAVTGVCDIDADRLEAYCRANLPSRPPCVTTDYRQLLACPELDVVLICTPDTTHREIALAATEAGKAMLLEKPVATTAEDTLAMQSGLTGFSRPLYLGFVLRYAPVYQAVKSVIRSGRLGEIITVSAMEMLDARHASSFYRRWHRFRVNNGGLMNAKCCHDLDLLSWLTDDEPVRVSAAGGLRIFVPRSDAAARCRDCPLTDSCAYVFNTAYYQENFGGFHSLSDLCVYNSEKDIVDHECMLIQYRHGAVAQFELCMAGFEENRTMSVRGSLATLDVDFYRSALRFRPVKGEAESWIAEGPAGGHGGGDEALMADLIESVAENRPVNHIRAGCQATLLALAGEESMKTGRTIDLATWPGGS